VPGQQPSSAIVVDSDLIFASQLAPIITGAGLRYIPLTDFLTARHELSTGGPDVVVANVRLGEFNGIHLAYLAKIQKPQTRVMIYGRDDRLLAREVQAAGAFYVREEFVPYELMSFLHASLPARDRRGARSWDRRQIFRGGRRTTDLDILHVAVAT
jgi:DNA-binding response OmpR family regulator